MKLLLTAGGITNLELEQAFLELTNNKQGLKIAYITTAGDSIEWIPETEGSKYFVPKLKKLTSAEEARRENWLQEYKSKFETQGHEVVIVDLKEDSLKIKQTLETVDVIDVGGGDINYLLDWAKRTKLGEYLKNILDKGVLYTGTSAGSMLLNPDIGFTWWEPDWIGDRIGLGIINFMFQPLHGENNVSKASQFIERKKHLQSLVNYPWKIYLVMDGQAIKVDGDKIEHIGPGVKESI